MHYIVIDLEWNNAYAHKSRRFINEIIEVGAVMLDENLNQVDEFARFVRSQISKKLRGNIKRLTNITNDDVRSGDYFEKVMSDFTEWIGSEDNVILSWGDGDIRVLIENFRYLKGIETVPFLSKYIDIQRYFQIKKELPVAQQIGLFPAAELVGVNPEDFAHHRALEDSLITAECFRRVFDKTDFFAHVQECNKAFYGKLSYKPHAITNINSPLVDKSLLNYICDECGVQGEIVKNWRYSNQFFRAIYVCPSCGKKVRVSVRFKQYFDRLETKKNISPVMSDKAKEKQTQ